jgi:integrase
VRLELPKPVIDAVQEWLKVRPVSDSPYIFSTGEAEDYKSAAASWDKTLRKIAKAANVKFSSHWFRHTLGKELAENGQPDERIAEILGDTVETVRKYYRWFSPRYQANINQSIRTVWPAEWR